jgi:membrane protein YdbS with pleckstrin-like domain
MVEFINLLSQLREQLHATLSRSDILRPLAWLVGTLFVGSLGAFYIGAPWWFSTMLAVLLAVAVLLQIFTYIYCLFTDKDALRSEKYSLHKMAIEHGIYGDSHTGLIDPGTENTKVITAEPAEDSQ